MRTTFFVAICSLSISGCSTISEYWQKPTKYKQMPERDGWQPPVATLSLDASRRLVISADQTSSRFTCPEAPPDVAISSLSETLASLNSKAGTQADFGSAYQAVAQAIHARTSTVEFWRTTSSMYCVLLMNGRDQQAKEYIAAALSVAPLTKDTIVISTPPGKITSSLQGAIISGPKNSEADKKAALEKAKENCTKVPDEQKATNADCQAAQAESD